MSKRYKIEFDSIKYREETTLTVFDNVHVVYDDPRVNGHREYDAILTAIYVNTENTTMFAMVVNDTREVKHVSVDSPYVTLTKID